MKVSSTTPEHFASLAGADIYCYGHLPVAAAYCRRLGIVDLVNHLVPSQMHIKPGVVVQAMVLDTLCGRTPLYRIEHFMDGLDTELLLGEAVEPSRFNDTNLARTLDAIFAAGPSRIVTELGIRATKEFALDTSVPSYDTTSTNVWGAYRCCEAEKPPPGSVITHGHSKDKLPHLKQFMTELLCVDRGVPIFGQTLDGNASDKTSNNRMLSRISTIMARHGLGPGAFVYAADSAMVTEKNLNTIGDNRFVTRLPATYKECGRLIEEAVDKNKWEAIGVLAETLTGPNRPNAEYHSYEGTVNLYGTSYRAVVVHSSSHDKRRQKKLARSIAKSSKRITAHLSKLPTCYACEPDARAAVETAKAHSTDLHTVQCVIHTEHVRKRGRPPANRPAPTKIRYRISWELVENHSSVQRARRLAGCFVLLTNVPKNGTGAMNSKKILQTYKGQYGVESDFVFLKDPLVVNDIFIKTPSRIDALGMVLIVALMVWRLMERTMREYVKGTGSTLEGWRKRQTDKPTAFMMSTAIRGIMVACHARQRIFLKPPGNRPTAFLKALGLDASVFLDPTCKCYPKNTADEHA